VSETANAQVIERVRKLLAKTTGAGCTPEEAEAAFKTASRIMAEHNLDMAEVEAKEGGEQSFIEEDIETLARWELEDNLVYGIVKRHFFVEAILDSRCVNGKWKKVLRFFGLPHNVQTARFVHGALHDAFDGLFAAYRKQTGAPASDRRIFVSGVASGFNQKMDEERQSMEIERDILNGKRSGATALSVANIGAITLSKFQEAHPKRTNNKSSFASVTGSQSALDAGYKAGKSLNLNRAIGGGSKRGGLATR
jgi:SHS2 domain-containing protein